MQAEDKINICKENKHKPCDNKFGCTWCVLCGRLFNKPCGKNLEEDKIIINKK